jgi:hypothetical protein
MVGADLKLESLIFSGLKIFAQRHMTGVITIIVKINMMI